MLGGGAVLTSGALAGCSESEDVETQPGDGGDGSDGGDDGDGSGGGDDGDGSDGGGGGDGSGGGGDGTEAETETEEPSGEPDVERGKTELVVDDSGFTTDVYVAAEVVNRGDGASGRVTLTVNWFDADGNYIDDSRAYLATLGAGETWLARVTFLGTGAEEVDDFEISGEFETEHPRDPSDAELVDSDLLTGDEEVKITGQVENRSDDEIDYIEVIGKLYDGDGNVLATDLANQSGVPGGETWRFELNWLVFDRADQVADYDVLLNATLY